MSEGKIAWVHQDSQGKLHDAAVKAYEVAKARAWPAGDEGSALWRAWLVSILGTIANLGELPVEQIAPMTEGQPPVFRIDLRTSTRDDNADWQNVLSTGLVGLIANRKFSVAQFALPENTLYQVTTVDGGPPKFGYASTPATPTARPILAGLDLPTLLQGISLATGNTGQIGVWEGITLFLCVGVLAGAVAWIESMTHETEALELQVNAKQKEAADAMTRASELVEKHQERERQLGAPIPYDAAELGLLQSLRETIKDATGWQAPALKSIPNVARMTENIAEGLGWGTIVAMALAVWLLLGKRKGIGG